MAPLGEPSKALPEGQPQEGCAEQCPDVSFWSDPLSDPTALFTLWLALATSLLWLYTFRLWQNAKLSFDDQADKAERELRPYMVHEKWSSGLQSDVLYHRIWSVIFVWKNHGTTPAMVDAAEASVMYCRFEDAPEPTDSRFSKFEFSRLRTFAGKGGEVEVRCEIDEVSLRPPPEVEGEDPDLYDAMVWSRATYHSAIDDTKVYVSQTGLRFYFGRRNGVLEIIRTDAVPELGYMK